MSILSNNDQYTVDEYEAENEYFEEYDQEMVDAVNEADYYDCMTEEYHDDSLIKLIVDVQSYLMDAPTDSPLLALQYKMYTYLKQRAYDMGMDVSSF
ncbi:hypothetical protein BDB01DRAFT_813147 [Pilobolus umbonatus]|nr:hypothetical protein BDB01DRAFT_813147 [Pilobolus umbonatus]